MQAVWEFQAPDDVAHNRSPPKVLMQVGLNGLCLVCMRVGSLRGCML